VKKSPDYNPFAPYRMCQPPRVRGVPSSRGNPAPLTCPERKRTRSLYDRAGHAQPDHRGTHVSVSTGRSPGLSGAATLAASRWPHLTTAGANELCFSFPHVLFLLLLTSSTRHPPLEPSSCSSRSGRPGGSRALAEGERRN
jgi:hypothetical protein